MFAGLEFLGLVSRVALGLLILLCLERFRQEVREERRRKMITRRLGIPEDAA